MRLNQISKKHLRESTILLGGRAVAKLQSCKCDLAMWSSNGRKQMET